MKPKFLLSEIESDLQALQQSFLRQVGHVAGPLVTMGKRRGSDDTQGEEDSYHKKVSDPSDSAQGPLLADV